MVGIALVFQVLPEFSWSHPGVPPEKMAEVKFTRKIELAGDVLDRKPPVREQQTRLIKPGALDVLVDRALAGGVKQSAQSPSS